MGVLTLQYIGRSGEKGSVGLSIPDLTALNVESYTSGGLSTAYDDLKDAIDALTLMNPVGHTATAQIVKVPEVLPASPLAQREIGLLVLMADPDGHKTRIVVPGIDLSLVAQEGSDNVPLSVTELATLITALEAHCVDPITGGALTVYRARVVGRNN